MATPLCSSNACIHRYLMKHSPKYRYQYNLYNTTDDSKRKERAIDIVRYMINAKVVVGGVRVVAIFTDDFCPVCGYALFWKAGVMRRPRSREI